MRAPAPEGDHSVHRIRIGLTASCLIAATAVVATAASPTPSASSVASPSPGAATPTAAAGRIAYTYSPPGGSRHVFTMDADGSAVIQMGSASSFWGVWSPDGERLAVTQERPDGRWTGALMSADGTDPVPFMLPDDEDLNLSPLAWSPDGGLTLEGWGDSNPALNGIYTGTPEGGVELSKASLIDGGHPVAVGWSPDGTTLLFLQLPADADMGALYVTDADGTTVTRLTPEGQDVWLNGFNVAGSWSPDSSSVSYTAFDDRGLSAAFVVAADGGDPVQVSDRGGSATGARFSPDGQWVLYDIAPRGATWHDLWLVRPDGTEPHALTDRSTTGAGNCCGAWSPDGQHVLFQNGDASAAQLWVVASDGTGATQVTTEAGAYSSYSWAPAAP